MELKKLLIVLGITIIIIGSIMFGTSYAWYSYANAEVRVSGKTINEVPTVIFAQTEYLSSSNIIPIYDEDRYNFANKFSFTVTLGENLSEYQTGIEISLKDVSMSEELKINNFKYELLQDSAIISSGNFSDIGFSTIKTLLPLTILKPTTYPETYNYELYIWLSDDKTTQNNLMNKFFNCRVDITSATKK